MPNKCPKNDDRGTWYFARFCKSVTPKDPRYVYCKDCPYGPSKKEAGNG